MKLHKAIFMNPNASKKEPTQAKRPHESGNGARFLLGATFVYVFVLEPKLGPGGEAYQGVAPPKQRPQEPNTEHGPECVERAELLEHMLHYKIAIRLFEKEWKLLLRSAGHQTRV